MQNNGKLNYFIKYINPIKDGLIKFTDFKTLNQEELDILLNLSEINNYLENLKSEEEGF